MELGLHFYALRLNCIEIAKWTLLLMINTNDTKNMYVKTLNLTTALVPTMG